jgi:hypothetical protein
VEQPVKPDECETVTSDELLPKPRATSLTFNSLPRDFDLKSLEITANGVQDDGTSSRDNEQDFSKTLPASLSFCLAPRDAPEQGW